MRKENVKVGDNICIYHIFGATEDYEHSGVVTDIYDAEIYGTWGDIPLYFDDDWEVVEDV